MSRIGVWGMMYRSVQKVFARKARIKCAHAGLVVSVAVLASGGPAWAHEMQHDA